MQMVSDVVLDVGGIRRGLRHIACKPLAGKEDVVGPVAGGVGLCHDLPANAVPIVDARRFLNTTAISIIGIGDTSGGDDAVFRVVSESAAQAIIPDITCSVVSQAAQVVVRVGGLVHTFARRASGCLVGQIAPRIVGVAVGPVAVIAGGEAAGGGGRGKSSRSGVNF